MTPSEAEHRHRTAVSVDDLDCVPDEAGTEVDREVRQALLDPVLSPGWTRVRQLQPQMHTALRSHNPTVPDRVVDLIQVEEVASTLNSDTPPFDPAVHHPAPRHPAGCQCQECRDRDLAHGLAKLASPPPGGYTPGPVTFCRRWGEVVNAGSPHSHADCDAPIMHTYTTMEAPPRPPHPVLHEARGHHAMLDLSGCDHYLLNNPRMMHRILLEAVEQVGAHVLQSSVYPFEPQGVSVVLILAESHASIHTYPEHGVAMVDVFTCGHEINPEQATALVAEQIPHVRSHAQAVERGVAPRRR